MPGEVLTAFSIVGALCGVYSLSCSFFVRNNIPLFLRIVVVVNLLYSLLTIASVIRFYNLLNPIGLVYFVGEVIIILLLVCLEVSVLRKL